MLSSLGILTDNTKLLLEKLVLGVLHITYLLVFILAYVYNKNLTISFFQNICHKFGVLYTVEDGNICCEYFIYSHCKSVFHLFLNLNLI